MTLTEAEKIVQQYGAVLAAKGTSNGPAYCITQLKDSPQRIVQAMKLWLAHEIKNRSLTQEDRHGCESTHIFHPRREGSQVERYWQYAFEAKA